MKKISLIFSFLLLFIFCFVGSTYAAEEDYIVLPNFNYEHNHYIIIRDISGNLWMTVLGSNSPLNSKAYISGSGGYAFEVFDDTTKYYLSNYAFENGVWKFKNKNLFSDSGKMNFAYSEFLLTNYNIYSSADSEEVFFSAPPTLTPVEEMVAEETPKMAEKVIQTMKITLLCGVGCLAFLVCLVILPKVLYRFL